MKRPARVFCLVFALVIAPTGASSETAPPMARISDAAFEQHLNVLVPELLASDRIAGASVAVIRDGKVAFARGYGFADTTSKKPISAQTEFNVGSVSKTLTAWGVLKLVEAGKVDLDRPVDTYLKRWHIPKSAVFDASKVTIRRLLSHTGGLSLSSVPDYAPQQPTPDLVSALSDPSQGVHLEYDPGGKVEYSGGGYMVLQLMIEDVTGVPFSTYMKNEVLVPLGMLHSTFELTSAVVSRSATPYDKGKAVPYSHYAGEAAASLSSTAADLGLFVAANFEGPGGEPAGRGVLRASTVKLMTTPAPGAVDQYGLKWGLGYDLWPIAGSTEFSAGHLGQNTGWSSVVWTVPATHDGIVLLTNDSDGASLYTPPLCDWISWVAAPSFGAFCRERVMAPGGTLYGPLTTQRENPNLASLVKGLLGERLFKKGAGGAVLVAKDDSIMYEVNYGLTNLDSAKPVTGSTPFYIASLAKPLTAYVVLSLVSENKLALGDRLGRVLPNMPAWAQDITIDELLSQQTGIPDYYDMLDYSKLTSFSNADAMTLIRNIKSLNFTPGARFEYSNSNYLLLGQIIEQISKEPVAAVFSSRIFVPFGMHDSFVWDRKMTVPDRAVGYEKDGTRFLLDDYDVAQAPSGSTYRFQFTTTGAGGVFSSIEDLFKFDNGLRSQTVVPAALLTQAYSPVAKATVDDALATLEGYGFGWFASARNGHSLIWHDGGKGGFRSVLVRIPDQHVTIIVLSNLGEVNARHIASAIVDAMLPAAPH